MMKQFSSIFSLAPRILGQRNALLILLSSLHLPAVAQSFAPASTYDTSLASTPEDVALGDVNGDGRLDIVSANFSESNVGVLLGQAAGGFAPISTYSIGSTMNPTRLALGDVDGDGRLDVVTTNVGMLTGSLSVLVGQAGGGFAPARTYALGAAAVVLGDVNGDGRLDLVTAVGGLGVRILLGQANGFASASTYSTGAGTTATDLALGDLNNDGRLDIVTANGLSNTASVLLGQAGGGFTLSGSFPLGTGKTPEAIAIGDLNSDGRLDIVTANRGDNTIGVLLGQVSGGFTAATSYASGADLAVPASIGDLKMRDVNGDGKLDIIASITLAFGINGVGILPGQATGFGPATTYASNTFVGRASGPEGLAIGDLNGDGRVDIAVANSYLSNVGVLLNTGTFLSTAAAQAAALGLAIYPNPAHASFTVHGAGKVTRVELVNSIGQVVVCQPISNAATSGGDFQVATELLPAGVYTLRLQLEEIAVTKRVLVK